MKTDSTGREVREQTDRFVKQEVLSRVLRVGNTSEGTGGMHLNYQERKHKSNIEQEIEKHGTGNVL